MPWDGKMKTLSISKHMKILDRTENRMYPERKISMTPERDGKEADVMMRLNDKKRKHDQKIENCCFVCLASE